VPSSKLKTTCAKKTDRPFPQVLETVGDEIYRFSLMLSVGKDSQLEGSLRSLFLGDLK
jgi:hypothetical protein